MSEAIINMVTGEVQIVGGKPHTNAQRRRQAKAEAKAARMGPTQARSAREMALAVVRPTQPANRRTRRSYGLR